MTWTEKRIRLVKQGTGVEENGTARPAPFLHITCPYHSISFPGIYLRFRFRCPLNSFISYPMYKQLSVNLATIANTKQDLSLIVIVLQTIPFFATSVVMVLWNYRMIRALNTPDESFSSQAAHVVRPIKERREVIRMLLVTASVFYGFVYISVQ